MSFIPGSVMVFVKPLAFRYHVFSRGLMGLHRLTAGCQARLEGLPHQSE